MVQSTAGLSPRRPGFDIQPIPARLLVDKVALEQVFLSEYLAFPCKYNCTNTPHSSSSNVTLMTTSGGNMKHKNALSHIRKSVDKNCFHTAFRGFEGLLRDAWPLSCMVVSVSSDPMLQRILTDAKYSCYFSFALPQHSITRILEK
jgi:hypothetical protein